MTHQNIKKYFADFLFDRLSEEQTAQIRNHLAECVSCREEFAASEQIYKLSGFINSRGYELSPAFSVVVMEQIESGSSSKFTKRSWFLRHLSGIALTVTACLALTITSVTFLGKKSSQDFSRVGSSISASSSIDKSIVETVPEASSHVHHQHKISENEGVLKPLSETKTPAEYAGAEYAGDWKIPSQNNVQPEPIYKARTLPSSPFVSTGNSPTYGEYIENNRMFVSTDPLSTFSIDVDTGSYTNVRSFLNRGSLPPKDAVRVEEFLNYFDYSYKAPSDQPFALTYEIAPSPLENGRYLLHLGIRTKDARNTADIGWNLVFLVDVSGSMMPQNRLPLIKESLKMLTRAMRPIDRIALVTYAGNAGVVLNSTSGAEKEKIIAAIDRLGAGGSTNGAAGIEVAYQIAAQNMKTGGVNRVILATDGDFNVGNYSFSGLIDLIEKKRETGITLTTLGVGDDNYNEKNLEQLANKGNGNYLYLDSLAEAERTLIGRLYANMEVVAKDVKIQAEFNPQHVTAYRLIGYDNRQLKKEDFVNDQVDAGETGSGHTVTAIYEIALKNSDFAKSLSLTSRYSKNGTEDQTAEVAVRNEEIGFVKMRYKEPEGLSSKEISFPLLAAEVKDITSKISADFRFAAAVSYFGAILRNSQLRGNYRLEEVEKLAQETLNEKRDEKREEFVGLVRKAANIKNSVVEQ